MPRDNRITKNYYLRGANGRGSVWAIWVTPVISGANNIYFAGSGHLRDTAIKFGFPFHASFHRNGNAHIKYEGSKLHRFQLTNPNNFPICSIYTNLEDLIVPHGISDNIFGNLVPIDIEAMENPDGLKWSELFIAHFETSYAETFIKKFQHPEFGFSVVDRVSIGQGREILVMFRFIEATSTSGEKPDLAVLQKLNHTNRLTIWGYRSSQEKHIAIHDVSPNLEIISGLYKKA